MVANRKEDQTWACKLLNIARPEGFEPPTLRSEVLSNPQPHRLIWNRSQVFEGFSAFHSIWFHPVSSHCGNIRGNNRRYRCGWLNGFGGQLWRELLATRKDAPTLRYFVCVQSKSFGFSTVYPTLFPRCFHAECR
jgi:hypothetical protein